MFIWLTATLLAQDVGGTLEQDGVTTAREKIRFAGVAVAEMKDVRGELETLYQDAQVNEARRCLELELSYVDELISVSEASTLAIPDALAAGNHGQAEQEFRKITVALMRVRQSREEGFACAVLPPPNSQGWSGSQTEDSDPGVSED